MLFRLRALLIALAVLFGTLATPAVLTSCVHVYLISNYDEKTDDGLTALQKEVDALVDHLQQTTPMPDYAASQVAYSSIHGDFAALYSRNQLREKNTITIQQLDQVKGALDEFETQHKTGKLNAAMLAPARDTLAQAFRATLKLELAKKELVEAK